MADRETNYCAHLAEWILRNPMQEMQLAAKLLDCAQKFRMPENGTIFEWDGKNSVEVVDKYCRPFRLPYNEIALEYPLSNPRYDAAVTLAFTPAEGALVSGLPGTEKICFIGFRRERGGDWLVVGSAALDELGLFTIADADSNERALKNHGFGVMQLLAALSCHNVETTTAQPPAALNKRRAQRGKVPFYSYHVLMLAPGKAQAVGTPTGTHASPRIHLRRGHVRRLESKNVWVNACVVGNKALGMVTKDYSVRAHA